MLSKKSKINLMGLSLIPALVWSPVVAHSNPEFVVSPINGISPAVVGIYSKSSKGKADTSRVAQDRQAYAKMIGRYNTNSQINGVLKFGMRATHATVNALAVDPIGGPIIDFAVGEVVSYASDKLDEVTQDELRKSLDEFYEKTSETEFEKLYDMKPEEAFEKLKGYSLSTYQKELNGLDPDAQTLANNHMIKNLSTEFIKGQLDQIKRDQGQDQRIDENDKRIKNNEQGIIENSQKIAKVSTALITFQRKTTSRIDSILTTQGQLIQSVTILDQRVETNYQSIKSMEKLEFMESDPIKRWKMVEMGMMDGQFNDSELEVLKAEADQKKMFNEVQGYISDAQEVVGIFANLSGPLGIPGKTIEKAQEAVKVGQAAFSAFAAFSTGNYLGAVSAVAGLFGGKKKGPSPMMQQLALINKKLDRVLENQQKMMEKLQQIEKNQYKIMELIIKVAKTMSEQMTRNHEETMEMLGILNWKADATLKLTRSIKYDEFDSCRYLYLPLVDAMSNLDFSYEDAVGIINPTIRLEPCLSGLNKFSDISDTNGADAVYYLSSYSDQSAKKLGLPNVAQKHYEQIFAPAVDTLRLLKTKYFVSGSTSITELYKTLAQASLTVSDLMKKEKDPKAAEEFSLGGVVGKTELSEQTWNNLVGEPIFSKILISHIEQALVLYRYLDVVTRDERNILTSEELRHQTPVRGDWSGQILLQNYLALVNTALIQESLLSGDLLLSYAEQCLGGGCSTEVKKMMDQILANNPVFKSNVIFYILYKKIESLGRDGFNQYELAYEERSLYNMKRLLMPDWQLQQNLLVSKRSQDSTYQGRQVGEKHGKAVDVVVEDGEGMSDEALFDQIEKVFNSLSSYDDRKKWEVTIDGHKFTLPTPSDLKSGELVFTPQYHQLLELRDKIGNALYEYEFYNNDATDEEKSALMRMVGL